MATGTDAKKVRRVAIFGTHPKQFNGYSKVVYELIKAMSVEDADTDDIELHVFGFQKFYDHPGHRKDVPERVHVYDAWDGEVPKAHGFGVAQAKAYVERIRPDVCVVFNDMMVLTAVMGELKDASNRAEFKVVAYIDQVYLNQKRHFIDYVNQHADAAIAFTPKWRECIQWQGLKVPCYVLPHGFNATSCYPIPRRLTRKFYGVKESDFLILNLNRNQPRKRWDICMQAFAEVVARRPEAPIRMVIATELRGSWDLMELLVRELRKRGLAEADAERMAMQRIIVPGHPQQLTDEETNVLLNLADVGINTCDGEGFGLCNFEQAAIGIPQVVPKLGGFLHFFEADETAVMIDPVLSAYADTSRDGVGGEMLLTKPSDYADAILRLYDDPALRDRIGKAGRKSILERFPWSSIARQFRDIVDAVCPPQKVGAAAAAAAEDPDAPIAITSSSPAADEKAKEIEALRARLRELGAQ
jgi:glycosyltransferase involved in cell wall biosynthesis